MAKPFSVMLCYVFYSKFFLVVMFCYVLCIITRDLPLFPVDYFRTVILGLSCIRSRISRDYENNQHEKIFFFENFFFRNSESSRRGDSSHVDYKIISRLFHVIIMVWKNNQHENFFFDFWNLLDEAIPKMSCWLQNNQQEIFFSN